MPGGIRFRITAVAMLSVTLVLVGAGVALLIAQQRLLTNSIDEALNQRGQEIERTYSTGADLSTITGQGDEDAIAQVVRVDGQILASTPNFAGQPALPPPEAGRDQVRTTSIATDESNYRLVSRTFRDIVVHTGTPIDDVEESVAALRKGLLVAVPIVALMLGALIFWLVGRTLRPVEMIRTQVADITGANLHERVPELGTKDEIARLARTMNDMLERVEDAANRQQRFVADASHELRSPLTRMRTELEVDLGHPETADHVATHLSILEETNNLQQLVEDLLQLARHDGERGGADAASSAPVDLDDLVLREVQRQGVSRPVRLDVSRVSAAQTLGDQAQLSRVVRNISDNAVRHARTAVTFATYENNGVARLEIGDDGPGIPEHQRATVFERFARLDEARPASNGGTGLGLAIALEIIHRHGGTIVIETPDGPGTTFVVELPSNGRSSGSNNA